MIEMKIEIEKNKNKKKNETDIEDKKEEFNEKNTYKKKKRHVKLTYTINKKLTVATTGNYL